MSTIDERIQERTATLNDLERQHQELLKRFHALEAREEEVKNRTRYILSKRRTHKMIVLGSTIWNEYRKFYQISDDENLRMLDESDEEFIELAKMIFKEFSENVNAAQAPGVFISAQKK